MVGRRGGRGGWEGGEGGEGCDNTTMKTDEHEILHTRWFMNTRDSTTTHVAEGTCTVRVYTVIWGKRMQFDHHRHTNVKWERQQS